MFRFRNSRLKIENARQAYEKYLNANLASLAPHVAFSKTMDWYETSRVADTLPIDEDGDMLLYQWGTHDWGKGPNFELELTRQFIRLDRFKEPEIWQLNLTYRYADSHEFRSLGSGDKWCSSPVDVIGFRAFIDDSESLKLASQRDWSDVGLKLERV